MKKKRSLCKKGWVTTSVHILSNHRSLDLIIISSKVTRRIRPKKQWHRRSEKLCPHPIHTLKIVPTSAKTTMSTFLGQEESLHWFKGKITGTHQFDFLSKIPTILGKPSQLKPLITWFLPPKNLVIFCICMYVYIYIYITLYYIISYYIIL